MKAEGECCPKCLSECFFFKFSFEGNHFFVVLFQSLVISTNLITTMALGTLQVVTIAHVTTEA